MVSRTKRKYEKTISRIAYTIEPLSGIYLDVKASANAWWIDKRKIDKLISAFELNATISEACRGASIHPRQYYYFLSIHPQFEEIEEGLRVGLALQARWNIARKIKEGDVKTSWKFLEKVYPEEFGYKRKRKISATVVGEEQTEETIKENKEDEELLREYEEKLKKLHEKKHKKSPLK